MMKELTVAEVLAAVNGEFFGPETALPQRVSFVTRDSREAGPGCLFAAIPGERADGHDFLEAVCAAGAVCAICQHEPAFRRLPYILVRDTVAALGRLAAYYRAKFAVPVVGVTGSVGKTSAKEMIASVLSQRFRTLKTMGNYNNELGVPLTLFGLEETTEAAVVEMGISDFGEMERLTAIVRPDIAVITVVGHSHLEKLGDLDGVLRAKTAITAGMPAGGLLIVNGDDAKLAAYHAPLARMTYGISGGDVRAENISARGLDGMECDIVSGSRRMRARINAFGDHMVYAALAGAAVGLRLGLSDEKIVRGIAGYEPVGRRSRALRAGECIIIDDCYNANPDSVLSALRSLSMLDGRRVCILGDMLELGEASAELHAGIGRAAAQCAQLVLCCGEMSRCTARAAAEHTQALWFADKEQLLDSLAGLTQPGDRILVKASRGMRFEDVTERLKSLYDDTMAEA